jgi:hypothetical protein
MKLALVAYASLLVAGAASGCAREPPRSVGHVASPPQVATAGDLSSTVDAAPPAVGMASNSPDTTERDAGVHDIVWNWKGAYVFTEVPFGAQCPACVRYRVAVEKCPGPCKVHVDADGPQTKARMEGVGRATSNLHELEVHFTGYRADDLSNTGFTADAVLLTLEAAPGDHMILHFGALQASDKRPVLIVGHTPLPRAR